MQLNSAPYRRRVLSLTPLIDVVFLLLVFFMLASTFTKFGTVAITTGGVADAAASDVDLKTIALLHVSGSDAFRINGRVVKDAELDETLRQEHEAGRTRAVIVVRPGATTGDLIALLTRVRRIAFRTVQVVD